MNDLRHVCFQLIAQNEFMFLTGKGNLPILRYLDTIIIFTDRWSLSMFDKTITSLSNLRLCLLRQRLKVDFTE